MNCSAKNILYNCLYTEYHPHCRFTCDGIGVEIITLILHFQYETTCWSAALCSHVSEGYRGVEVQLNVGIIIAHISSYAPLIAFYNWTVTRTADSDYRCQKLLIICEHSFRFTYCSLELTHWIKNLNWEWTKLKVVQQIQILYIVSDLIQTMITCVHNNNSSDALGGNSICFLFIICYLL